MNNAKVIYTPFDLSAPVQAGRRRFWKQVLPVTSIDYKGQKVDFDPDFHMDLSKSFENKAFDQVPVVFADGENRHNMDPRNFGGDVLKMEYRGPAKDQGTWALIEADRSAARAIKRNPRLGVSARIRQMVEKADGRKFDRAIEHICLTMNPRVTGMAPWQAVDLSDEVDADIEVVDLTAAEYTEETEMGATATSRRKKAKRDQIDLSALSDEQFQELLDLAETFVDDDEEVDEDEEVDPEEVEDTGTTPATRKKKSKTKITVEKESEDDGDDDDEDDDDVPSTDLSDADRVIRDSERSQFQQMRYDLAEEKWEGQRNAYLDAGVPAFLLDLADPICSLPDALTIDLSDDEQIDATATIRKMLDGIKGVVDLTGEVGHQIDLSQSEEERSQSDALLDDWTKHYG